MKTKRKLNLALALILSLNFTAQIYTSGVTNIPGSLTGVGTNVPNARLEVASLCTSGGTVASLVVSKQICGFSLQGGSYIEARDYATSPASTRFILTNVGRVGIDIARPVEKLHLHDGAIRITGANSNGGPMVLFGGVTNGNSSGAPSGQWGIEYVENNSDPTKRGLNFWRPNFAHDINGNGAGMQNNVMFFRNDNHIGIMTDKPTANLTVNGNALIGDPSVVTVLPGGYRLYVQEGILTERVKVALHTDLLNWADYVFAPEYKLMPVKDVESYIKKEGHLPNVPSASEVLCDGIDLAKMDATLLRQIEELWLHIIKLEKENEELKNTIKNK
jgi:hypothetical protein